MTVTAAGAAKAYLQMARLAAADQKQSDGELRNSFSQLVDQALNQVVASGKAADTAAVKAVAGQGDIIDVVTAVAESELALETLVSVRDRVISAYEEIIRMPI